METETDFADFAGTHWGALVRSAVFLGCGVHEAQDVAQSTLERCWSHWGRVQRADDRDAYVFRILLNCLRDTHRRRSSTERPTATFPDTGTPDPTEAFALAESVHRALDVLSPEHREVVVLRTSPTSPSGQTAEALRLAPGTVKSRLSRALARLALDTDLAALREGDPR